MMKKSFILAIITHLNFRQTVLAMPSLVARQCDTLLCPGDIENEDTFGTWLYQLFQPASSTLDPTPPTTSNRQPEPESDIFINTPPPENCQPNVLSSDSQGDRASTNADHVSGCQVASSQIIFPGDCTQMGQNTVTARILSGMDNRYMTSINPLCSMKGGVAFWIAKLTPEQIETLRNEPGTVKAITPNSPYESDDLKRGPVSTSQQFEVPAIHKRGNLKKRAALYVESQATTDFSLIFLSTPKDKSNKGQNPKYVWLTPDEPTVRDREPIRVYLVGTGADMKHGDFFHHVPRWLYTVDVQRVEDDTSGLGVGTCLASKIGGLQHGVFKNAEFVIVKSRPEIASFIDALGIVFSDLDNEQASGRQASGYTVISIGASADMNPAKDDTVDFLMEEYIRTMIKLFHAVIVVPADVDKKGAYGEIQAMPAMLSTTHDIIVVGAVQANSDLEYGKRFAWSSGGPALTVSAPGNGFCATRLYNDGLQPWEGASFAGAIVSGLAAYFLSLPDLHDYFSSDPASTTIPKAVKDFMVAMSYNRYDAQFSVWNGLDSDDTTRRWDPWPGIPQHPQDSSTVKDPNSIQNPDFLQDQNTLQHPNTIQDP